MKFGKTSRLSFRGNHNQSTFFHSQLDTEVDDESTPPGAISPQNNPSRSQHHRNSFYNNSMQNTTTTDLLEVRLSINNTEDASSLRGAEESWSTGSTFHTNGNERSSVVNRIAQRTCLRPALTLRTQLFLSFGVVSFVSLVFVMVTSILVARQAGDEVLQSGYNTITNYYIGEFGFLARYVADAVDQRLENLDGSLLILREATRDRLRGYPNAPGYQNDTTTPFRTTQQQQRQPQQYPLPTTRPIPLDWQLSSSSSFNAQEAKEHLGENRYLWYENATTTVNDPVLHFQGTCDPSVQNETLSPLYRENCNTANNNITTGGVLQPTETLFDLHDRTSNYAAPFFKPIYEYHQDIYSMGIFFANDGAGASIVYPGRPWDGTRTYTSLGCDWLTATPNPRNPQTTTIGNRSMVSKCHPAGQQVGLREFNPLETDWYRLQAQQPDRMAISGPHNDLLDDRTRVVTLGRSIYDDLTTQLIGTVSMEIPVAELEKVLERVRVYVSMTVSLVTWQDGILVAGATLDATETPTNITIEEYAPATTDFDMFNRMKDTIMGTYHETKELQHFEVRIDAVYYAATPVPLPPENYDENYSPQLLVVVRFDGSEGDGGLEEFEASLNQRVDRLMTDIGLVCAVGVVLVVVVLFCMSLGVTAPLRWITRVGDEILASFGSGEQQQSFVGHEKIPWFCRYAPRTEITNLVEEFQRMVNQFSGRGTAKIFKRQLLEVKNPFALQRNFDKLYRSRHLTNLSTSYKIPTQDSNSHLPLSEQTTDPLPESYTPSETRVHWGPNVHSGANDTHSHSGSAASHLSLSKVERRKVLRSPLFWWLAGGIAIPLILSVGAGSVYVVWTINNSFPAQIESVKTWFRTLEIVASATVVKMRARYLDETLVPAMRDLYVFNRIAGWLFFGALQTAPNTLVEMETSAEACKDFAEGCPEVMCDCSWNDPRHAASCSDLAGDSRLAQRVYFEGLNQDVVWPSGERNVTSYPLTADMPTTTSFWTDSTMVPGFNDTPPPSSSSSSSYRTTSDRLHTLAALSTVQIPLYNYARNVAQATRSRGVEIGFEADGMIGGYTGCSQNHAYAAHFQSSPANDAFLLNPSLCPLGKYGFDARCTDWYANGKGRSNGDELHVSPAFREENSTSVVSSLSLPLIDPNTNELVAQTKVSLPLDKLISVASPLGTPLGPGHGGAVVAIDRDYKGGNMVSVNDSSMTYIVEDGSKSVDDVFMEHIDPCSDIFEYSEGCNRRQVFGEISRSIASGRGDVTRQFLRRTSKGDTELIHYAHFPVFVDVVVPIDPSDFSRGVRTTPKEVYSVAIYQTDKGLNEEFLNFGGSVGDTAYGAVVVLSVIIVATMVVVIYVASQVTVSITIPITQLLVLVKKINQFELQDDFPDIMGGSSEVRHVRLTFERLFMLIRCATAAFFSGEISIAFGMLTEALELFTKLGNRKAMGIANNNLGNTMLTMYRTMKKTGAPTLCGMTRELVIEKGCEYFKNAIDIGEEAIQQINQEEGFSVHYLIFMQQLSNRYFNRAVFLLTVRDDHQDPQRAEDQGLMDLFTSKDMDREVVDNGDHEGFKGEQDVHFELLLSRIKGLLMLMKLGFEDEWGIEDLFKDARKELFAAQVHPGHTLFRDMEPAGQMQRLDFAVIEYYRLLAESAEDETEKQNAKEKAARIAIRMLVEDDFLIGEAAVLALKALIDYMNQDGLTAAELGGDDPSDLKTELFRYRHRIGEALSLQYAKNNMIARETFLLSNMGDVSMECF